MKLDILAVGVHPDDVELGCSGVLLTEQLRGRKAGIIDLTCGELGTRGSGQLRLEEAANAGKILNISVRENLYMADGFFVNDKEHQLKVIEKIRQYQPEVVLCNAPEDRHPDHGRAAQLVETAAFLSGLPKIETRLNDELQVAWRPKYVFNYIQDRYLKPDFIMDITQVMNQKLESIQAYQSQFFTGESGNDAEPQTYISTPGFLESIIYRAKMFGKLIGVDYAEGFISKKNIGIQSFDHLILHNT
jgi:bacillithiol biosynthesis deacetylase BshB1